MLQESKTASKVLSLCEPIRTRDCSSAEGVLCEAKYGARKTRNCEKPGFCHRQKWPQKKEPKFSSVKWAKSSCEEGEEIELSASVEDITDGNMLTLQVFPEGKEYTSNEALLFVKIGELRK